MRRDRRQRALHHQGGRGLYMLNVVTCFLNVDTFFTAIMGRKGRAINFLRGAWLKNLQRKKIKLVLSTNQVLFFLMIAQTFSRHNRAQSEGVENNLIPKKISHPLHPPPPKRKTTTTTKQKNNGPPFKSPTCKFRSKRPD